ncbi:hypothetical protein GH714_000472 [Hevea brasiliensis]|uniref:Uncharacterized protein n=1 Tax=Hevea brasiliensis TaxID=3981 RepID=A0A6A6NAK1_HEVBR|nr:hypothetical protein GH714_000472 [Hevea brasiliensis]
MRQVGTVVPNGITNTMKLSPTEMTQEPENAHYQVPDGPLLHYSKEVREESQKAVVGASRGMQTNSSNFVSSSVSVQAFELCDDATTPFVDLTEQTLPNCQLVTCTKHLELHPPNCSLSSLLHFKSSENLYGGNYGRDYKSVAHSSQASDSEVVLDPQKNTVAGDVKVSSSAALDPSVPSSEEISICENNTLTTWPTSRPHTVPQSNFTSTSSAISTSQKNFQLEKGTNLQKPMTGKPGAGHLPPAFDDIIHVIRHSSFRVQNVDVGKLLNFVRDEFVIDELEAINMTTPVTAKSSSCSETMSMKSNISGHSGTKEMDNKNVVPSVPKSGTS